VASALLEKLKHGRDSEFAAVVSAVIEL